MLIGRSKLIQSKCRRPKPNRRIGSQVSLDHSKCGPAIQLGVHMPSDQLPSRTQRIAIGLMTAVAFGFLVLEWAWVSYNQIDTIPFSQFEQLVAEGNVTEVAVGQDTI